MIPWVTTGNFLNGLINYNESKKEDKVASLLHVNTVDNSIETFKFLYHELVGQSKRSKNLMHVSLNFHESDRELLTPEFLTTVAQDFLFEFGYPLDQPYLVYQHTDKGHPHIHIAVPMTKTSGGQINNSFTAKRMISIARNIEKKYGLHRVEELDELVPQHLKEKDFTVAKSAIDSILNTILKDRPGSFKEMMDASKKTTTHYNGEVCTVGWELSKKKDGITFFLKNEKNEQVAKGIKGSKLYGNLSFARLQEKLSYNTELFDVRLERIKRSVLAELEAAMGEISLASFKANLERVGVKLNEFYSKTGDVFGIEFLDLETGLKFKGSSLGKNLSWNSLKTRINASKVDTFMVTKMDKEDIQTETQKAKRMNWKEEVERLKREISLTDLVEQHGYVVNKKGSTKTALEYKGPNDTIIIYNHSSAGDTSGYYYTTRNNSGDKGDIINFLINKNIVRGNKEALEYLSDPTKMFTSPQTAPTNTVKFKEQKPFEPVASKPVDKNSYIIVDRGITLDIIDSNFNGAVFTTTHDQLYSDLKHLYQESVHEYLNKNIKPKTDYTVFPIYHIKDGKLVGQQVINQFDTPGTSRKFKHLVLNSDKTNGVWSNYDPSKKNIAVFENPIDAMSHYVMDPSADISYFGTIGNPSKTIIDHIATLGKAHQLWLAGDNDDAGQFFNTKFICSTIAHSTGATVTPISDAKTYKISIEGTPEAQNTLRKITEAMRNENPELKAEILQENGKITLIINKIDVITSTDKTTAHRSLLSLNEKLIYFYNANLKTIHPTLKDFNEDLLARPKQATQKRNTPKL